MKPADVELIEASSWMCCALTADSKINIYFHFGNTVSFRKATLRVIVVPSACGRVLFEKQATDIPAKNGLHGNTALKNPI